VRIHAGLADPEELGDLFRREAASDGPQYLALAIRQRRDRSGTARKDSPRQDIAGYGSDDQGSGALHREGERPRLALS